MKNSNLFIACTLSFLFSTKILSQTIPIPCSDSPLFSDTNFELPLMMNEILPEGVGGESWVEFYNCRPDTINFHGWFLTNNPMDSLKYRVDSFVISPGEFKVLQLPFAISRSFGLLQLWRPDSTMAYGMTFDGVEIGESIGFCGNMIKRQIPSPELPNNCAPLGIEELETANEGETLYYDFFGNQIQKPESGFYISMKNGKKKKICVIR